MLLLQIAQRDVHVRGTGHIGFFRAAFPFHGSFANVTSSSSFFSEARFCQESDTPGLVGHQVRPGLLSLGQVYVSLLVIQLQ